MADEITLSASLTSSKGGYELSKSYGGISVDLAGTGYYRTTQMVVTASEEVPNLPDGIMGYTLCKNMSTTAGEIVQLKDGTSGAHIIDIPPGGIALFQVSASADLYADQATGSPTLEITIVEL